MSAVLSLNSGSSSLKFALFGKEKVLCRDLVEGKAIEPVFARVETAAQGMPIRAVGHRLVYQGPSRKEHTVVTAALIDEMERHLGQTALHLPRQLAILKAAQKRFPDAVHVACFDSAFYTNTPRIAHLLPLPEHVTGELSRCGFHGLACEAIVNRLNGCQGNWICLHLGSGSSVIALQEGQPIEMTMGFSPLSGVMMGTRSGDLDPGVILYLILEKGYSAAQIEHLLTYESGLLGVSTMTADMKELLVKQKHAPRAQEAIDLFCHHLIKAIGSFIPLLGGLDGIVFTGGIGFGSPEIRRALCSKLAYFEVVLDDEQNKRSAFLISAKTSRVTLHTFEVNEERVIADHARALSGV